MDSRILRENTRAVILGITGFVVFLLLLRFVSELISGPDPANGLLQFLYGITDGISEPFMEIIDTGRLSRFNISVLFAVGAYILIGIAITELLIAFVRDSIGEIIVSILDLSFKVLESLLLLRIVNDLFLLSADSEYVRIITDTTEWAAVLFPIQPLIEGRLQPSIVVTLIILGFLDYYSDILIRRFIIRNKATDSFKRRKSQEVFAGRYTGDKNLTINVPSSKQTVVVNTPPEHNTVPYSFYRDGVKQE